MESQGRLDIELACAYVRGVSLRCQSPALPKALLQKPLCSLTVDECEQLLKAGQDANLKLYRFKNHADLPRVRKVLSFLKGVYPQNLLDVGSGRGVFLFPFLHEFPTTPVTSVDLLPHRVELLKDISLGGVTRLTAEMLDICTGTLPEKAFDAVTLLEVLEHIPDVEAAVRAAVRLAKRCIIVTVPSKPDNNPEHIHLLTKDKLADLFIRAGCSNLRFDGVNGHLFMTVHV